jgi:hypothetical protein
VRIVDLCNLGTLAELIGGMMERPEQLEALYCRFSRSVALFLVNFVAIRPVTFGKLPWGIFAENEEEFPRHGQ